MTADWPVSRSTEFKHKRERTVLQRLASECSVETAPWDVKNLKCVAHGVDTSLEVFVPWTPTATWVDLCDAALAVRRTGCTPVPHIAARRLKDEGEARLLLGTLRDECAVDSVLLIGGDAPVPAGSFSSSLELMRTGALLASNIRRVGIAGYPEGHPMIADPAVQASLKEKLRYLEENALSAFVVSQFCFDGGAVVHWIKQMRASSVRAPIRVGLAGPTNALKLMRLAMRCGVGNSLQALKGRVRRIARLAAYDGADDVTHELACAIASDPDLSDVSIHLFAFGGIEVALQWKEKLRKSARLSSPFGEVTSE